MKQKKIKHKGIEYLFELFEMAGVCIIDKGHLKEEYTIRKTKSGWKCNCWGDQRWGHCWHRIEGLPAVKKTSSLTEPWAEWAEDGMVMREKQRNEPT